MKAAEPLPPLPEEYRIRARRLLNQLRKSDSKEASHEAAARFRRLKSFSEKTVAEIVAERGGVKLKHALAVIALEHGHGSWRALKTSVETPTPVMYDPRMDVFLNRWFARYEDARASLEEQGGFLLPFGRQFFVCEEGAIRVLGLDPGDPDWGRIGHDWAKPRDPGAWLRLKEKREQALLDERPSVEKGDS